MGADMPTLGSLLEFDFEAPPEQEIDKLREYGRLANGVFESADHLDTVFWYAVGKNAFSVLGKALDRPLTEILAGAWSRYQPFLKYCVKPVSDQPATEHLLTHKIDASLTPVLKVLLNKGEVGKIQFKLVIALELEGGALTIKGGRFMSVRPGQCRAAASLSCAGKPLIERKTSPLKLPGELSFGAGIPIIPTGPVVAVGAASAVTVD